MIKSMTGFGRGQAQMDGKEIVVEIHSVNARYLEASVRTGRNYTFLEEDLKSLLKSTIARGKVEISVALLPLEGKKADICVNEEMVRGYLDAMRAYQETAEEDYRLEYDIPDEPSGRMTWSSMIQFPDVFRIVKLQEDEETIRKNVLSVAGEAMAALVTMRETEGRALQENILLHLATVEEELRVIEREAPGLAERYRTRLCTRLHEWLEDASFDEQRILTEVAVFAEKADIDEEIVRLHSHIGQMRAVLEEKESVGRKLDFLVQEMNREVNTIGSKVQDVDITNMVVDMKAELEKIREQIQNVE